MKRVRRGPYPWEIDVTWMGRFDPDLGVADRRRVRKRAWRSVRWWLRGCWR